MASKDSLEMRLLAAKGTVVQKGADEPVAIRLRYIGTGSATSVTITTATNLVTVSSETSGTATKTYTFGSGSGTIGALADNINADGLFEAKVIDALRSDVTTASYFSINTAVTAGTDANGVIVWDCTVDTSVYKAVTATLTNSRDFNTARLAKSHRVNLQEIRYYATLGGAAANLVRIYQRRGTVETQIFGLLSVSATDTTISFASGLGKITGGEGDELIVRIQDGSSISDTALALRVTGLLE